MDERLLEMYDWETLSQENQREQDQLFDLETTSDMEQLVLVQDNVEQSPEINTFESAEENDQQQRTQMAEECNQTSLSNMQNHSTLHTFDSILFQNEQMEEQQQQTDSSPETSQQNGSTMQKSS